MAGQLGSLIEVCYREPENVKNGLKSLRKAIFAPKVESFDYPEKEDHLKGMTRTLVISNAARAGDER
jgi:aminopeptidase 2